MSHSVLLISDNHRRSASVAGEFGKWFAVETIHLRDHSQYRDREYLLLIIDVDLSDKDMIGSVRTICQTHKLTGDRVFIIKANSQSEMFQANALGATATLSRPVKSEKVSKIASRYVVDSGRNRGKTGSAATVRTVKGLVSLQDGFYESVLSNKPIEKDQVESCSDQIVSNIAENTIAAWLDEVLNHHSYTYRHCMTVTGLAAAFGMQLGMSRYDVRRLAVAGLVHDIGKVRIPLNILDKPGKLTPEERLEINKHPGFGAEILSKDGQFGDDILDIVLHHHELLDGSGYPDGLRGDQISNPVRIMTIVDIYSALIDERSYKAPLPADKAYRILLGMEGKLEMCIVEAFEPVALNVQPPAKDIHTLQAAAI